MHRTRHPLGLAAVLLALALLLSACGGDDPAMDTGADDDTAEAGDDTAEDGGDDGGDDGGMDHDDDGGTGTAVTLELGESDVGEHLVDGDGNTVYLFTPDEQGQPTCTDSCADNWPPVTADGEVDVGDELDQELVGSTAREDGTEQVTYNDWPLYHFANDAEPGDVNGQGANDVWFVVNADGEAIEG